MMLNEELKKTISILLPELEFPEIVSKTLNIQSTPSSLLLIAQILRDNESLKFDFLFSLTSLDWPEQLEVIYHLRSSIHNHELVLRIKTEDRINPIVPSVCKLWPTAEFHEREVFDLFGVKFQDHPDLRRIFLEDDWLGYPLRKDYVDEINIIDL